LAVEGRGGMWVASPPVSDMAPSLNAPVDMAPSLNAAIHVLKLWMAKALQNLNVYFMLLVFSIIHLVIPYYP
jgi:hypothetical protein